MPTPGPAPRVAFATYDAAPNLSDDDRLFAEAAERRGLRVEGVSWRAEVDWTAFDAVVPRTTWDYFLVPEAFRAWIAGLEQAGVPMHNPPAVLRSNMHKGYLLALAADGHRVVPTHHAEGAAASLGDAMHELGAKEAVVKPAVSAGGWETFRTFGSAEDDARFARLANHPGGVLVQPFLDAIVTDGEWSLLFFAGRYSHAAVKRAKAGDFRVQHTHGGRYEPATPPASVVRDAEAVLAAGARLAGVEPEQLLYGRVDGLVRGAGDDARLVLMELELLEPSLFLLQAPEAAERAADALLALVRSRTGA